MRRHLALCLSAMLTFAACADETPAGPGSAADVVGTYTLRTVNGQTLPSVIRQGGGARVELTGFTLTLNPDATYSGVITARYVSGTSTADATERTRGTYTLDGRAITLVDTQAASITGTVGAGTMTLRDDEGVLVFRR